MPPLSLLRQFTVVLLAIPFLAPALLAQTFEVRHQRDLSGNPSDLHFRMGAVGESSGFHIGERIPLTLEFWSDTPNKYKLNGATYDRSGRLPTEEFVLERADVADPYVDYFSTGVLGGLAGGLRGNPVLDAKPYRIELDLNDWFRFDRPGSYRLYLKSHRMSREQGPDESGNQTVSFAAVSNVLEVRILPDDGWTAAKIHEIESVLTQPEPEWPKPGDPPVPYDPLEDKLALARRELRYFASQEAVEISFQDARKLGRSPDTLLLFGARDRLRTIDAFDRYLADPQTGIREWDIRVRALFTLLAKESLAPLPLFAWQVPKDTDKKELWASVETRHKHFEEIVRAEALRLIPIATQKDKAARKISGEAIASIAPDAARAALLVPPDDYGLSRKELIAQFPTFPVEQQAELLRKKWDLVRGAEMIPALQTVIDRAESRDLPDSAMGLQVWGIDEGVPESAFRRLYEVSPQEAKRVVAHDLASGKPRFAGFAAREIPSFEIPEADGAFLKWLNAGQIGALPLIAKFGTARVASQMREHYLAQSWPCAEEASFIGYFVRALPYASPGGAGVLLKHAMADREDRGCHHSLLSEVAQVVWNSALQTLTIASLDDSDPVTAESAAAVLASHGGPEVEPFLWKRLERWNGKWRGRTAEFEIHPIRGGTPNPEGGLGPALFNAIASAKAWVLDEPRRKRLSTLCLDDPCRETWGQVRPDEEKRVEVSSGGSMYPAAFRVDSYQQPSLEALKDKLKQFPQGTVFRWCPQAFNPFDAFSPGQRADMFQGLSDFLSARSMSMEPYDEAKCAPGSMAK